MTQPEPATEKRVILIKPGDVLLIGGVRFGSADQGGEAMRRFKELTGITPVVFFADDIQLDALTAAHLAQLTESRAQDLERKWERAWRRLFDEADAATDEHDKALLQEAALIAQDPDAYCNAYPVGLARREPEETA